MQVSLILNNSVVVCIIGEACSSKYSILCEVESTFLLLPIWLSLGRMRCFSFNLQLISYIEERKLDTEGLLRIPGVAARVKVTYPFGSGNICKIFIHNSFNFFYTDWLVFV